MTTNSELNRRTLIKTALALATASTPLFAQNRRLKIGHTGITWGFQPTDAEQATKDVGNLGYHGYESFGNVLEAWEAKGGFQQLLEKNRLSLRSAYCPVNLMDTARRKEEVDKMVRWGKLIKKLGGAVSVIGPNSVRRDSFNFSEHRANIIAALNEIGKALDGDAGTIGALHQHTGTCIESRDETYAVMQAIDPRYVKFGPDIGQLQKGGVDPVKVVQDFQSLIRHVHLKDFDGGEHYLGYCPVGRGKVNIPAILDLLEKSNNDLMIMVELDPSPNMPIAAGETARIAKAYLEKQGYSFKS